MPDPLVSLILVSNKPHFAEAAWRSYSFQDYPNTELVVIDASPDGTILRDRADVYYRAEVGGNVGPLRNHGLREANGDWFIWWDDDDWRHPSFVSYLMENRGAWGAGLTKRHWIDLDGNMEKQGCQSWPVFGASVYRHDSDLNSFRKKPAIKTDSWWLTRMFSNLGKDGFTLLNAPFLYAWVYHAANLSNADYGVTTKIEDAGDFGWEEPWGLMAHLDLIRAGASTPEHRADAERWQAERVKLSDRLAMFRSRR